MSSYNQNNRNYSMEFPNSVNYSNDISGSNVVNRTLVSLSNNRRVIIFIIILIPIFILMGIGFSRKKSQSELGWTCILLIITLIIFVYALSKGNAQANQYILLICLILIQIGFIIYFITFLKQNVNNGMYIKFYNDATYSERIGTSLSFISINNSDEKIFNELIDGSMYSFAIKESMPNDLGTEGTYSFWLNVCPDNFLNTNNKWKTVWFRGDQNEESLYKNKTPGVYLETTSNNLIITVACENGPDEGNAITIDNIPLNEAFCITIVINGRSFEIFKNGLLDKSISLTGAPLMKNTNITKGINGFHGQLFFFRYDSSALTPSTINDIYLREKMTFDEFLYSNADYYNQNYIC